MTKYLDGMKYAKCEEFINNNYNWLTLWLLNAKREPVLNPKTTKCGIVINVFSYGSRDEQERLEVFNMHLKEHIKEVLFMLLWGKYQMTNLNNVIHAMADGFYTQYKRLPLPLDKVQIYYFGADKRGERFMRVVENADNTVTILSDCRIELINE